MGCSSVVVIGWVKILILHRAEILLAYTTEGAGEVIGQVLESCSGSNAIFGVAYCGIIYPTTSVTNVLFHNSMFLDVDIRLRR